MSEVSAVDKIKIALLCDLTRPQGKRELDADFISGCVMDGDLWAIDWKYPGLNLGFETPSDVRVVCDVLDMWAWIERSYNKLSEAGQSKVSTEGWYGSAPRFPGFDGNAGGPYHIAKRLVRDLERWSEFQDRDLNSHAPTFDADERMLAIFKPIWEVKVRGSGNYELSADQLISVLRERTHPDSRVYSGDSWTPKRRL